MTTALTIKNLRGQRERLSLPRPHWAADGPPHYTGIRILALYRGPRTGRMFARTYSFWQDRRGQIEGERVFELDLDTYLTYCEIVGCEPVGVAATDV